MTRDLSLISLSRPKRAVGPRIDNDINGFENFDTVLGKVPALYISTARLSAVTTMRRRYRRAFPLDTSQVGVTGGKDVVGLAGDLSSVLVWTEAMLFMRTTSMPLLPGLRDEEKKVQECELEMNEQ
jgi:hypothetical protein